MPEVYDSWDLAPRPFTPRNRLYAPPPQRIGNGFVESLSSYVVRLAEAHAVSTGDLVRHELSRHTSPPLVVYSHGINGLGGSAARWVKVLETATGRSDLRYLTLLPFKNLFPRRALLRTRRAWCPECYQEMTATGTVYEPLVWYLKFVEVCSQHRRRLATTCYRCHQPLRPLHGGSRTGRCFWCGMDLGREGSGPSLKTSVSEPTNYQLWMADAMGQLLAHAPALQAEILADRVRHLLSAYADEFAEGNCAAVAETAQLHYNVVYSWFYEGRMPQAGNLLGVWYRLKLPVSLIFSPDSEQPLQQESGQPTIKIERKHKSTPSRRREQVRRALAAALDEQPPPSLAEVARRLGYLTRRALRYADPALCAQIAANYRQSEYGRCRRNRGAKPICELSQVRRILENHLNAEGRIPPLLRIAASLGYAGDGYVWHKFPELCRALSAKIARQKAERMAAIESIFEWALQEVPPPPLREVYRRIGLSSAHMRRAYPLTMGEKLKARRREYAEACRTELREKLKAALNETPPPPPREIYVRLGITEGFARHNFPELRRAIIMRHRQYRHQQSLTRQEAVRQEIRAIVGSLHEQGVCPSLGRVTSLLKNESLLKWQVLRQTVKDARRALGTNSNLPVPEPLA